MLLEKALQDLKELIPNQQKHLHKSYEHLGQHLVEVDGRFRELFLKIQNLWMDKVRE